MKLVLFLVLASASLLLAVPTKRDDGEAHDRQKRAYYYYSSYSAPSEPNVVIVEQQKPTTIIDHKAEGGTGMAGGCTSEFPSDSTMCVYQDSEDVVEYGYSPEDIQYIVDFHNEKRAEVDATDMVKMYWDDNLAEVAQKLSQACFKGHDLNSERKHPAYTIPIGQNYCGGLELPNCLEKWYGEHKSFTYGDKEANAKSGKMLGHYTQMMNKDATGIGCGFAYCFGSGGPIIHCNYAYGQTKNETTYPWTSGEKGSACGAAFLTEDKLCDVGLSYCQNYGAMDLATATCDCISPYKGDDCTTPDCSKSDRSSCGTGKNVPEKCHLLGVLHRCRYMCGVCQPGP